MPRRRQSPLTLSIIDRLEDRMLLFAGPLIVAYSMGAVSFLDEVGEDENRPEGELDLSDIVSVGYSNFTMSSKSVSESFSYSDPLYSATASGSLSARLSIGSNSIDLQATLSVNYLDDNQPEDDGQTQRFEAGAGVGVTVFVPVPALTELDIVVSASADCVATLLDPHASAHGAGGSFLNIGTEDPTRSESVSFRGGTTYPSFFYNGQVYSTLHYHFSAGVETAFDPFFTDVPLPWDGTATGSASYSVSFELAGDTKGNVDLTALRFTGTEDQPSSEITVNWAYVNDQFGFAGGDQFDVRLYYSADQVFDNSDILITQTTATANQAHDSGEVTFRFGKNGKAVSSKSASSRAMTRGRRKVGYLKPDLEHPYVFAVIDHGADDSQDYLNNQASYLLPMLEFKRVIPEVIFNNKRFSTLMKETTFELTTSPQLSDKTIRIEYKRLESDVPLPGEEVEWTLFAEGTPDSIKGIHKLAGKFEFRAAIELNGKTFSSEFYGATKKGSSKFPLIEVQFPPDTDLLEVEFIKRSAYIKWKTIDNEIVAGNLEFAEESLTFVVLNTAATEQNGIPPYSFEAIYQGQVYEWVDQGRQPMTATYEATKEPTPPKDVYDPSTHTAKYVVAHLHTHPRYDFRPIPARPFRAPPGPSEGLGDEDKLRDDADLWKMELVGLVYDFVGTKNDVPGTYFDKNVTYPGWDGFFNDPGKLYPYVFERRRNLGRK